RRLRRCPHRRGDTAAVAVAGCGGRAGLLVEGSDIDFDPAAGVNARLGGVTRGGAAGQALGEHRGPLAVKAFPVTPSLQGRMEMVPQGHGLAPPLRELTRIAAAGLPLGRRLVGPRPRSTTRYPTASCQAFTEMTRAPRCSLRLPVRKP